MASKRWAYPSDSPLRAAVAWLQEHARDAAADDDEHDDDGAVARPELADAAWIAAVVDSWLRAGDKASVRELAKYVRAVGSTSVVGRPLSPMASAGKALRGRWRRAAQLGTDRVLAVVLLAERLLPPLGLTSPLAKLSGEPLARAAKLAATARKRSRDSDDPDAVVGAVARLYGASKAQVDAMTAARRKRRSRRKA